MTRIQSKQARDEDEEITERTVNMGDLSEDNVSIPLRAFCQCRRPCYCL